MLSKYDLLRMGSVERGKIQVSDLDPSLLNEPGLDELLGKGTSLRLAENSSNLSLGWAVKKKTAPQEVLDYAADRLKRYKDKADKVSYETPGGWYVVDYERQTDYFEPLRAEGIYIAKVGNSREFEVSMVTREAHWGFIILPGCVSKDWLALRDNLQSTASLVVNSKFRGYSGGHDMAALHGWNVGRPNGDSNNVLWWDTSTFGTWSGYYPSSQSVVPVK